MLDFRFCDDFFTGYGVDDNNCLSYYHGGYHSVENYLSQTNMANEGVWGTDLEISLLAHMLDMVVWVAFFPKGIDHSLSVSKDVTILVIITMLSLKYCPVCDVYANMMFVLTSE